MASCRQLLANLIFYIYIYICPVGLTYSVIVYFYSSKFVRTIYAFLFCLFVCLCVFAYLFYVLGLYSRCY